MSADSKSPSRLSGLEYEGKTSQEYIIPIQERGYSDPVTIGGNLGRVNFNHPPQDRGVTPGFLWRFETIDKNPKTGEHDIYEYQLEKKFQGSRWEDSSHYNKDLDRLKTIMKQPLGDTRVQNTLQRMWGRQKPNKIIYDHLKNWLLNPQLDPESLRKDLIQTNTWRQVSKTDPIKLEFPDVNLQVF